MDNNILNEELGRMKSLFGYERGVVISEQVKDVNDINSYPACVRFKKPTPDSDGSGQISIDGTGKWEGYYFFNNGRVLLKDGTLSNYTCEGNNIKLSDNVDPNADFFKNPDGTVQVKDLPAVTVTANKKRVQGKFVPEKFPLKYMMQGENVKKLQQALDVRGKSGQPNITGKFYNATQAALDKKAKELGLSYDRNVGLTQDDFNKITNTQNTAQQPSNVTTKDIKGYQPKGLPTADKSKYNYVNQSGGQGSGQPEDES